jgi:hypothetical protein
VADTLARSSCCDQPVGADLRAREDDHRIHPRALQHLQEELGLPRRPVHRVYELLDSLGRGLLRRRLHRDRVAQRVVRQRLHLVRQRRREEEGLPRLGHVPQDLVDLRAEAHVEHPVGLVEHQHLDL